MKKIIDFEYDLWTAKEGRCMVQVRRTGEECEMDRETFRLLRVEEKRLRRERIPEKKDTGRHPLLPESAGRPLFLQTICSSEDENGEFWLTDSEDFVDVVMVSQLLGQFRQQLTPRQLDILEKCLLGGMSLTEYARTEMIEVGERSKKHAKTAGQSIRIVYRDIGGVEEGEVRPYIKPPVILTGEVTVGGIPA